MEGGKEGPCPRRNCLRQYWRRDSDKGRGVPSLSKPLTGNRDLRENGSNHPALHTLEEAYHEASIQGKRSISRLRFPSSQRLRNTGHGIHLDLSQRNPENVRAKGSEALKKQINQDTARRRVLPSRDGTGARQTHGGLERR